MDFRFDVVVKKTQTYPKLFLAFLAQTGLAEVCWHLKDDASEFGRWSLVNCLLRSHLQLLNLLAVDRCFLHGVY